MKPKIPKFSLVFEIIHLLQANLYDVMQEPEFSSLDVSSVHNLMCLLIGE